MYENKKILILGAAKSGIAVAKLLAGKNNKITITDLNPINDEIKNKIIIITAIIHIKINFLFFILYQPPIYL